MNRITYGMSIQRTLLDQHRNMFHMDDILRAMSSNKLYSKPSDSPIHVSRAMRLQTELRVNQLYSESIDRARSWTRKTDDSLRNIKSIIDRVKELTARAANGPLNEDDKQQIEAELRELKNSAITIGNDDYMGRHQFSGHKTDMKFVNEDGSYNKNLNLAGLKYENMDYIIGVSQKSRINFTGVEVFGHEKYHTNTRADKKIPFSDDKPTTILGGSMDITIQKYKQLYSDVPKEQRPADYEKDKILETTDGDAIELKNITYYANYDKDDINSIVEDMNKSLRGKIALASEKKYPATGAGGTLTADDIKKRKEYETQLRNAVQFVNDNGKIALVTDNDYGVKAIKPNKIIFNTIEGKGTADGTPLPNKKVKLENLNDATFNGAKNDGNLPVATSFDIKFKTYKKDANGDLIVPTTLEAEHDIKDIVFAKTYKMNDKSNNKQTAELIAYDLQAEIDKKIRQHNSTSTNKIDLGQIKVVVGDDNSISIVTDKYNDIAVNNKPNSGDNFIEEKLGMTPITNPSPYTPSESKHLNSTSILDFKLNPHIAKSNEDYISNIGFDLDITTYPQINSTSGDLLYVGHLRNLENIKKELEEKNAYKAKFPGIVKDKEDRLNGIDTELTTKKTEYEGKEKEYNDQIKLYDEKKEELNKKYPLLKVGEDKNDPVYKLQEELKDPKLTPEQRKTKQEEIDKIMKERQEAINNLNKELSEINKKISHIKKEMGDISSQISRLKSEQVTLPNEIKKLKEDEKNLPSEIKKLEEEKKKLEDLLKSAGANPDGKLDLNNGISSKFKIKLVKRYTGDEKQIKAQMREDIENQIKDQISNINDQIKEGLQKRKDEILTELKKPGLTNKDKEKLEKSLSVIEDQIASDKMKINYNDISVTFNNGDISIKINKDIGYKYTPNENLAIKEFGGTDPAGEPIAETKANIDIPFKVNTDPNQDTHVYMDLNLKITEYEQDQFGDEDKTKPKRTIEIDEITLNKKYPSIKPGSNPIEKYTDDEIKEMVYEDAKKAIEEKLNSLNPPIQKNGIKIERNGDNIRLVVSPDIKAELSNDSIHDAFAGNSHLDKQPDYVPTTDKEKKPEREMMPFFEMMDRLIYMAHNGDSKGLDRMISIIDWHANNNLKVQGQGGGRVNMYDIMTERTNDLNLNYKDLLSDTMDTDYAKASADLSLLSYVYRASLAVTAKIIQPSLVDFLR